MFCPQCKAEYRPGFTRCADCDVALVPDPPQTALAVEHPVDPGDPSEDPFCAFWSGDDPRIHAEICEILNREGIPNRTVRRADHLFNINIQAPYQIGVPFSLFPRAESLVKEAYGSGDESCAEESRETLALPEATERRVARPDWDPNNWYPEDATSEIWTGQDSDLAELLRASLAENQIHSRVAEADAQQKLFILPADEVRAREIVREVVEAVPPE